MSAVIPDADEWRAMGRAMGAYEHSLRNATIDLAVAFDYLCQQADVSPLADRRAAFEEGYNSYWQGETVSLWGKTLTIKPRRNQNAGNG